MTGSSLPSVDSLVEDTAHILQVTTVSTTTSRAAAAGGSGREVAAALRLIWRVRVPGAEPVERRESPWVKVAPRGGGQEC